LRIPEQIGRLAIVIGIVAAVTVLTRFVIIPRSLVSTETHWAQATQREIAKPVKFAGSSACQDCHEDVTTKKTKGFHKALACEACHGPAIKHTEDPSEVKPPAPRDRKFCPVCHAYDSSRPTGFPQINPTAHNPLKACISCHNPHDPVPPTVPRECSACHAQIERTKSLSSHALIQCTTCHKAPDRHKIAPRSALPSKPETREFCGTCHGSGIAANEAPKEAPKVNISTHGGQNLCWECHYPHLPEGGRT
jgi:DnaJ-class molecular chaperone